MPSSVATVRLYRVLQRFCRTQLPNANASSSSFSSIFLLQPPLDPRQAGSSRITQIPVATRDSLLQWLSLQLDDPLYEEWIKQHIQSKDHGNENATPVDWVQWTSTETLQEAIRHAFRIRSGGRLEWAIRAYQLLLEQSSLLKTFSSREERGLRVAATSQFVGTSSDRYRFAYRIRIENRSAPEFQLLGRSWIIQEDQPTDPIQVHDPMGGAVGQFPVLQRGQAFEYMSGCELATPTGVMKGCFHFRDVANETLFEIPVEPFLLKSGMALSEQPLSESQSRALKDDE